MGHVGRGEEALFAGCGCSRRSVSARVTDPDWSVSVCPPVKWKGILDAVNRLPVDVAER